MNDKKNGAARLLMLLALGCAALFVAPRVARADGDVTRGNIGATGNLQPQARVHYVEHGFSMGLGSLGTKVYEATSTVVVLVVDEMGVAPTTGRLIGLEITTATANTCAFSVFDASATANVTGYTSTGNRLGPPLPSAATVAAFDYAAAPKQFHRGLVAVMGGSCQGYIRWAKNGGPN